MSGMPAPHPSAPAQPPPLAEGERGPDFALPRPDGSAVRLYAGAGGRPAVVAFAAGAVGAAPATELAALRDRAGASLHVVLARAPDSEGGSGELGDVAEVLVDAEGRVAQAWRARPGTVYLLDRDLRVVGAAQLGAADLGTGGSQADPLAEQLAGPLAVLQGDAEGAARDIAGQAPVLLIPRALPRGVCAQLVDVWRTAGNVETGVERSASGGREDALAPQSKRRRDHTVTDQDLLRRITATVGRRVMPEVRRAFAYRATRFEGFKIASYDAAAGGFFTAHRDNLSPSTAHRRFALSLNLNDGYEGGYLRFPEYGGHRYRPAAGEALVFSCALQHEVLPVSAGQRFVLLSFLFGEDAVRAAPSQPHP